MQEQCPDCGVRIGQPHEAGCDVERCSVCKIQKIQCGCEEHKPQITSWTGEWPGVAECRMRGRWAVLTDRGWQRCQEDVPGATEDLGRLAFFEQEGYDRAPKGYDRAPEGHDRAPEGHDRE